MSFVEGVRVDLQAFLFGDILAVTRGDLAVIFQSGAYGASASFLTPYGYTTNLMVQNLGGYEFRDYFRAGLPLSIVYSVTVIAMIPLIFPF